jgi:RAT1-interacting protein
MVRDKQGAWDPQICLLWAETFLKWLKSNVEVGDAAPGSVWRVKFTPRVGVQLTLLQEEERREVEAGEDRVGFLPTWYWKEVQDVSGAYSSMRDTEPEPRRSSGSASTASVPSTLPTGWQI